LRGQRFIADADRSDLEAGVSGGGKFVEIDILADPERIRRLDRRSSNADLGRPRAGCL
jgi:hypothetical protein